MALLTPFVANGQGGAPFQVQPVYPQSPQDRLRISGRGAPTAQEQAAMSYSGAQGLPPAGFSAGQPPSGPGPAGPGQLYMPPGSPMAPKVVGKGYIRYSYKGEAMGEQPPQAGELTSTPQGRLYIIVKGDCLWNLSGTFFSDPWRWRDIWERNPYILNPDLIYPGRQLLLGQAAAADEVPKPEPLDSSYLSQPLSFGGATAGFLDDTTTRNADSILLAQKEAEELRILNAIIKRKILTSEFLAKSPYLWSDKDARGLIYPGDARIDPRVKAEAFQQFDEVPIVALGKTAYNVGDTLEIYRSERMVTYKKRKANLVRRVGLAHVIEVKGTRMKAVLHEAWDAVKPGDRVGRVQPFPRMAVIEYVTPGQALSAEVFQRVEQTLFPYPFHSFIIDRGTTDGVQLGDLFMAYRIGKEVSPAPAQLACAVHVGGDYATLATVMLYQNALKPGDRVDLVRRMQSQ